MRDWPPATTRCPECGHTVRIPITAQQQPVRDTDDRPATALTTSGSVGLHMCRPADQTPGE